MKKGVLLFISLLSLSFLLTGCLEEDDFTDDYTYTTIYPIEYATSMIYGDYSNVVSVYPDGADISDYTLTDKLLNNYSVGKKFVYDGLSDEGLIARDLLNINNDMEIIDAMKGMNYSDQIEELWLDPSNFLMVCRNIKSTLIDYEDNVYTKEKIEDNYTSLKESISILDVDIYNLSKNGSYKSILVTNDTFNYLTKYSIDVLSIDPDNESKDKALSEAKQLINGGAIKYIYSIKGDVLSDSMNTFINDYKLTKIEINPFETITEEQRINGENYISLMNTITDEFKKELFK